MEINESNVKKWLDNARNIVEIAKKSLVDCYGNNVYTGNHVEKDGGIAIECDNATLEHIDNFQEESGLNSTNDFKIFWEGIVIKPESVLNWKPKEAK